VISGRSKISAIAMMIVAPQYLAIFLYGILNFKTLLESQNLNTVKGIFTDKKEIAQRRPTSSGLIGELEIE